LWWILGFIPRLACDSRRDSAYERLEEMHAGREVLERREESVETPEGTGRQHRWAVAPEAESVEALPAKEVEAIRENAARASVFISRYAPSSEREERWLRPRLDAAFSAWQREAEHADYSERAVVEIVARGSRRVLCARAEHGVDRAGGARREGDRTAREGGRLPRVSLSRRREAHRGQRAPVHRSDLP
jgi:hypothetical protein